MAATKLPDYAPPDLYDLIYSWYRDDIDYYVGAAKATRGPALEVGRRLRSAVRTDAPARARPAAQGRP